MNRELACLKALFSYGIKCDLLVRNPVSQVKMLAEDNLQTRVLTFTEQQRYLAKATPVLFDVATLMLETGMRPEEVCTIRPENVDLVKSTLQVPQEKLPPLGDFYGLQRRACDSHQTDLGAIRYPYSNPILQSI